VDGEENIAKESAQKGVEKSMGKARRKGRQVERKDRLEEVNRIFIEGKAGRLTAASQNIQAGF